MAYPSSLDSFSNPQGTSLVATDDHANQHRTEGSAIVGIETTLGTTAGTSVLKNFAAGDFPSRINSSNVLQQTLQGTLNNSVIGTPAITGGTANNQAIGTPALTGGTLTLPQIKTYTLGSAGYSPSVSGTATLDLSTASRHVVTMPNSAGAVVLATSNVTANQLFIVEILQGTAGNGTPTWFSGITWRNGGGTTVPTNGTTASRKDVYGFISNSGTTFEGFIVGQSG